MAPMLLGTSVGVIFNTIFPEWLILFLLTLLVSLVSIKIFKRGINVWRSETKEIQFKRQATSKIWKSSPTRGVIAPEPVVVSDESPNEDSELNADIASDAIPDITSDEGNHPDNHSEGSSDDSSDPENSL